MKYATISVRLTESEYERLQQKIAHLNSDGSHPPTNPTAVVRWLIVRWLQLAD